MPKIPVHELDFSSHEFKCNPYETYMSLRSQSPVWRLQNGLIALLTYDDVMFVVQNPDVCSAAVTAFRSPKWLEKEYHREPILFTPCTRSHADHRRLIKNSLTSDVIQQLVPMMKMTIRRLLDRVKSGESFDFLDVAYEYVGTVMSAITGTEYTRMNNAREWVGLVESILYVGDSPPADFIDRYKELHRQQYSYYSELIAKRKSNPLDDFVSNLIRSDVLCTDKQLADTLDLIVNAGLNTTSLQLSLSLIELSAHPSWYQSMRKSPDKIPNYLEELARCRGISQATTRKAEKDFTLPSGIDISEGSNLWVNWAAANHDPAMFKDPEVFNPGRENLHRQLNFGGGTHFCLGTELARTEMRIALEAILAANAMIECPAIENVNMEFPLTHLVIKSLPVKFIKH